MKTFFENGTFQGTACFIDEIDMFYLQEIDGDYTDKFVYPGDTVLYALDAELSVLYDVLRNLLFDNTTEYYQVLAQLPAFVQEAGYDSECSLTVKDFGEWIQKDEYTKIPNFYRYLYLVDCQFIIGSIQNLLVGMEDIFTSYYSSIVHIDPCVTPSNPDAVMIVTSRAVRWIASLLESYFVKAHSILDRLCKIGYELQFPETKFLSYAKIKSADLLWGARKKLQTNNAEHTLFEKCELVDMIESMRNEVIHNGSWELNPKVYVKYKNKKPIERFMLFPDINQGHLSTVKNRRHFFGNKTKVNRVLHQIHIEFQQRLLNTVILLNSKDWNRV